MVGHRRELGQGRIPKDGIVWQENVGDVEVNQLGTVVLALPKGDREADLPFGTVEPSVTLEKGLVG